MKSKIPTALLIVTIVTTLFLASCQPPKPAALSNDQVVQVVENTLQAINAGDYQSFTQDFSDEMKNAFTEEQFTSLADMLQNASGNFVSCADSQPAISNNQDYAIYRLTCTYDLESVIVTVTFKVDGDKVEGLFFDSTNLRKVSQ
ncbi:MAG: DUF3887 domain-containing protein [Chloroflexi bacterium]|nr:DUF3887 domain-containing protein [Chloroflexota bacterium]